MFDETTIAKLEFVKLMISDIETIVKRHGGSDAALDDIEGYHALLMCLQQIGESLSKIKNSIVKEKLPVDLTYKMRNIIAHDYSSIDKTIVASTIDKDIPSLKQTIIELLQEDDNNNVS